MPETPAPIALVYRDTLLPRSEVAFMRRQYAGFTRLRPRWVGRRIEPGFDAEAFPIGAVFGGLGGIAFKTLGRVPGLARLRGLGAVVVHAQFGRGGALALPLAEQLGLPLVVTFHGGDVSKDSHYRRFPIPALFALRMARLARTASALVCVSEGVRDRLVARGLPGDRAVVLPIGTDTLSGSARDVPGAGILFVGRLVEMKGADVLLDAVVLLRSQGIDAPVTLIGDGPDGAALRARPGLPGVSFVGWQDGAAVRAAMLAARLVCIPSVRARSGEAEGLPSVATEAMGLGVPVVASDIAGTAGLVEHDVNGLIFPARDAVALAAALAQLLGDPGAALRMGAAARATVAAGFDAAVQSAKLERLLLAVAARPPGTPLDFGRVLG